VRTLPVIASIVAATLLAACGQTGPLYLPEDDGATVITRPAGGAATPAPAPAAAPAVPQAPAATMPDAGPSAATPPANTPSANTPSANGAPRRDSSGVTR